MKRSVSIFITGLIVFLATSFTEAYNHLPENHPGLESGSAENAEFNKIYMNAADFPLQQGDIRIFKDVTQKVRNSNDDRTSIVTLTKSLFQLDLIERSDLIYPNEVYPPVIHSKNSRCITFRSLLI